MHWISFSPVLVSSRSYGLDSKNEKRGAFWLEIFLWIRQTERLKASPSFLYAVGRAIPINTISETAQWNQNCLYKQQLKEWN